jgi:uncharacterized protein DUF5989
VIPRPGGVRRRMAILASTPGSIADLARGLWQRDSGTRWLAPLAIFLCVFGLILIVAATVEALAPFIYAIF